MRNAWPDGCVKIWSIVDGDNGTLQAIEILSFGPAFMRKGKPDAVTALSFAPLPLDAHTSLLALGLESGRMELWKVPLFPQGPTDAVPEMLSPGVDLSSCHLAAVTKLAWCPLNADSNNTSPVKLHFASCSADCNCRIFEVTFQHSSDELPGLK